jgi:arachidonate 15-lipoxygenase
MTTHLEAPVFLDRHPPVSLPQDDKMAKPRRLSLEKAQEAHHYTYEKSSLRGVAMLEKLGADDLPSVGWLAQLTKAVVEISVNAAQIEGDEARSDSNHADHKHIAASLAIPDAGSPAKAIEHVLQVVKEGTATGPAEQIAQYAAMFQAMKPPAVVSEVYLDDTYARMRLAGSNPAWLQQVDARDGVPGDFGVTAEHYQAAVGGADSLEAAAAEGRLFLCSYRELLDATPGGFPVPGKIEVNYAKDPAGWDAAYQAREASYADCDQRKVPVAPLALFAVSNRTQTLVPVAIQLFPNGHRGESYPVFTPRDGPAWVEAKSAVQSADFNVHELISHLGLTHLVQEAFCLAMHNCLSMAHPLHRLLAPHFEGTFLINTSADSALVNPAGGVDTILGPTIGSSIEVSAAALKAFDFNQAIFPRQLASRGVASREILPEYPYRDDGLLVWAATERWVSGYVRRYYRSDADVVADTELAAFVQQVGQYKHTDPQGRLVGGGIGGVGEENGRVVTRAYLIAMVTQIIWNGSAQHAAVNFPQADIMSYAPNMPGCLMGPLPASYVGSTAQSYMQLLPPQELARVQQGLTLLLGAIHHTELGGYGTEGPLKRPWFSDREVQEQLTAYQGALQGVEEQIIERNHGRPAYDYLRPSLIPQSINI